jgi:hypothetical protein
MPRKRTEINKQHLKILLQKVLEVSDIQLLRSVDCDKLAKLVSEKTNSYVNGISFKRLYGFTKYPFSPSIQTLDIFSQFIGCNNWYHFESTLANKQPISKQELDIYLSFYDIDLVNDVHPHEGGFQSVSRKIALRFREDSNALLRSIDSLVSKPYAQIFFVEHFPDYDNLCNYFYKIYEGYVKYKNTREAKLFGNSMLFLKSFWLLDKKDCGKYLQQINKIKVDSSIHPFLIGRFYACNLLYDSFFRNGENIQEIYFDFLKIRKDLPKKGKHFYDFPAAEYIVSEALLHCKKYQKCIEIVELGLNDFSLKMEFVRKGYYRQMQLLWLIASKRLNQDFKIDSHLVKIKSENFYFISQKYFTVLLYYAKGTPEDLEKAKKLATEMGNKYFLEVLL